MDSRDGLGDELHRSNIELRLPVVSLLWDGMHLVDGRDGERDDPDQRHKLWHGRNAELRWAVARGDRALAVWQRYEHVRRLHDKAILRLKPARLQALCSTSVIARADCSAARMRAPTAPTQL